MTDWPSIISDLMHEQGISERRLCLDAGVQRCTFRKFMAGRTSYPIDKLDKILAVFGYELDAIQQPDAAPRTVSLVIERPAAKPAHKRLISYAGAPH